MEGGSILFFNIYEQYKDKKIDIGYCPNVNYALSRLKSELDYRGHEVDYSKLKEVNGKYEYRYDEESVIIIEQI